MKEFIESTVRYLVSNPNDVKVEETRTDGDFHEYLLTVNQKDIGRVVGKQGHSIDALRTLCRTMAYALHQTFKLNMYDPDFRRNEVR